MDHTITRLSIQDLYFNIERQKLWEVNYRAQSNTALANTAKEIRQDLEKEVIHRGQK